MTKEPTYIEVEPGILEMRFQHDDHEHGARAKDGHRTANGIQEPETAMDTLERSYRVTLRLINEGRYDLAGCKASKP